MTQPNQPTKMKPTQPSKMTSIELHNEAYALSLEVYGDNDRCRHHRSLLDRALAEMGGKHALPPSKWQRRLLWRLRSDRALKAKGWNF